MTHAISPAERKRREDAFNYARASVSLEGFKISKAEEQHALRFINGEIDLPEFLKGCSNGASHPSVLSNRPLSLIKK